MTQILFVSASNAMRLIDNKEFDQNDFSKALFALEFGRDAFFDLKSRRNEMLLNPNYLDEPGIHDLGKSPKKRTRRAYFKLRDIVNKAEKEGRLVWLRRRLDDKLEDFDTLLRSNGYFPQGRLLHEVFGKGGYSWPHLRTSLLWDAPGLVLDMYMRTESDWPEWTAELLSALEQDDFKESANVLFNCLADDFMSLAWTEYDWAAYKQLFAQFPADDKETCQKVWEQMRPLIVRGYRTKIRKQLRDKHGWRI